MDIETLNPHVMKILIAARKKDSISAISKRILLSYGWTNKWIHELISEGIFKEVWRGVILENSNNYKKLIRLIKEAVGEVSFYYYFLKFSGLAYCLTNTDAVYVWTDGRYNIARYRDYYPIYVKIKKSDYDQFLEYAVQLELQINKGKGVFFVPLIMEKFNFEERKGYKVEPLKETISFMKKNFYNFQPALEMIQDKYNKRLNVKYQEAKLI
ncbi:MAG: hypothetical protein AABX07_04685 [Nanoarchaeota archaeon]|mgnify:CR=1 FL=1